MSGIWHACVFYPVNSQSKKLYLSEMDIATKEFKSLLYSFDKRFGRGCKTVQILSVEVIYMGETDCHVCR